MVDLTNRYYSSLKRQQRPNIIQEPVKLPSPSITQASKLVQHIQYSYGI